jgi:hypothetical protein
MLELTYEHLLFQKFPGGYTLDPRFKVLGRGRGRRYEGYGRRRGGGKWVRDKRGRRM